MAKTFTCPVCARVSHHPQDVEYSYCGACHRYYPPEMGRELKASELKPDTVVIITKEGRESAVSAWVRAIGEHGATFYVGDLRMYCLTYRRGEELHDDTGRLHIYRYLDGPEPTSGEE